MGAQFAPGEQGFAVEQAEAMEDGWRIAAAGLRASRNILHCQALCADNLQAFCSRAPWREPPARSRLSHAEFMLSWE